MASITKSLSIIAAPGVYAGVSVTSGTGISVNAGGTNVTLRGLSITGVGGTTGIWVIAAAEVHIDNVLVSGLNGDGMLVSDPSTFVVRDSVFRANLNGIRIPDSVPSIVGYVERTRFEDNNGAGLAFGDNTQVDVSDSTFFNNTDGVVVQPASVFASVGIDQCVFNRGLRGINLASGSQAANATAIVGRTSFYHVNEPLHRHAINPTSTFTFVNNQFVGYSFTPVFDTPLTLR